MSKLKHQVVLEAELGAAVKSGGSGAEQNLDGVTEKIRELDEMRKVQAAGSNLGSVRMELSQQGATGAASRLTRGILRSSGAQQFNSTMGMMSRKYLTVDGSEENRSAVSAPALAWHAAEGSRDALPASTGSPARLHGGAVQQPRRPAAA